MSGGEPLMRDDIFKIARYGTGKGLKMAIGTSGILIDGKCAREIRDWGSERLRSALIRQIPPCMTGSAGWTAHGGGPCRVSVIA